VVSEKLRPIHYPACGRKIFQASLACADDGAKLTHRVTRWILQRPAIDRMSVSATAKALGVGWELVNQVAVDACRKLVYDNPPTWRGCASSEWMSTCASTPDAPDNRRRS